MNNDFINGVKKASLATEKEKAPTHMAAPLARTSEKKYTGNFFELVKIGSLAEITDAIARGADVTAKADDGETSLHSAAKSSDNSEVITTLIKAGAEVNAKDDRDITPLLLAIAMNPNSEIASALVNAGADVNASGFEGITPLLYAAGSNYPPEIIATMIKSDADMNMKGKCGLDATTPDSREIPR